MTLPFDVAYGAHVCTSSVLGSPLNSLLGEISCVALDSSIAIGIFRRVLETVHH